MMKRDEGEERPLCAVYVRLSKEDEEKQASESESIQNQKALLTQYAAERGWDVYKVYCDEDYSGADSLRPDFNRMLEAAQQKKFQIVLCKTQSRFTRDMELVEKYLHGLFPVWGVRFIAVADNADTEVKGNKKARQINGLVNEWYLEDLSENVRMVLDLKRREGQYIGGFPLYGYQKDPANKNKLVVDPPAAAVVRQIYRWSLEGHGRQSIAAMLNRQGVPNPTKYKAERGWMSSHPMKDEAGLWSKTTVGRILTNEMYTGVMVQGRRRKVSYKSKTVIETPKEQWYRVEGTHEAIIDRTDFEAVRQGLRLRARTDGGGTVHLLAGLVRCADCGSAMCKCSNGRQTYLRCGRYAAGGGLCSRHSIRLDRLMSLVSDRIRQHVKNCRVDARSIPLRNDAKRAALEQERRALAVQIEKRGQALRTLYLDRASGVLSEGQFTEWNLSFQREKERLEERLAQVCGKLDRQEQEKGIDEAQELLELKTVPRELVTALVEQIEIGEREQDTGRQAVTVIWKF